MSELVETIAEAREDSSVQVEYDEEDSAEFTNLASIVVDLRVGLFEVSIRSWTKKRTSER